LRVPPEGPGSRFSGMPIVVRCLFSQNVLIFFVRKKTEHFFSTRERKYREWKYKKLGKYLPYCTRQCV